MKKILLVFLLSLCFHPSYGQLADEASMLYELVSEPEAVNYKSFKIDSSNEVKIMFSSLFGFYKGFISSQDSQNCSFYPSCSVYGIKSIQKKGLIWGSLNSMDRLTRCNSLDKTKYEIHQKYRLLYDPLD